MINICADNHITDHNDKDDMQLSRKTDIEGAFLEEKKNSLGKLDTELQGGKVEVKNYSHSASIPADI